MALSVVLSLYLKNAQQVFDIVIMFGAGSGAVFLLRWYWWRINAAAEIAAMLGSGMVALLMEFSPLNDAIPDQWSIPFAVLCTTVIWVTAMLLTRPASDERLQNFVRAINPAGHSWNRGRRQMPHGELSTVAAEDRLAHGVLAAFLGCIMVYAILFGIGWALYSQWRAKAMSFTVAIATAIWFAFRIPRGYVLDVKSP